MKRYGPLAILLAVVPLLAFGPNERVAPTHWAFIVGISDYIHFSDESGGDLPGAERDARVVRDVLVERWGFPEGNIRMLLNEEATKAAITEGMTEWLPANARPGDQITIFFAGHGCQMWGEWIPTRQRLEYQTFPRLSAFAEVGWTSPANKDYQDYLKRLRVQMKRWDLQGVHYADVFDR